MMLRRSITMPSRTTFCYSIFHVSFLLLMSVATGHLPSEALPGAIHLADNTEKGKLVSDSILPPSQQRYHTPDRGSPLGSQVTYSLLQSRASRYFNLDSRNGQLKTARLVDRDLLCSEAELCCSPNLLPDYRSCAPSRGGYADSVGVRGSSPGAAQTQMCSFNLSVSVVSTEGQQPTVYEVPIFVCEENDHAPEFKVAPSSNGLSSSNWPRSPYETSALQPMSPSAPVYVVEISESVSVEHRIRLPTAEDIDSPPFNVQRYELFDATQSSFHFGAKASLLTEPVFRLETLTETGAAIAAGQLTAGVNYPPTSSSSATGGITGLELVVLQPLDREATPHYHLTVLAVDGGQPARTGTLQVQVNVMDANDHVPVFTRPVYEATVEEGEASVFKNILQVNATDQDQGMNAVIRYDWSDSVNPVGSNPGTGNKNDTAVLTREAMAAAPPSYWFRLNAETGAIYLRRPLDYELKRQYRFQLLAYNPLPIVGHGDQRAIGQQPHQPVLSATTNVIINVINLDDEAPFIVIDYVTGNQRQFKEVKENLPSPYFIAFVTVHDPDIVGGATLSPNDYRSDGRPSVDCQLDSHQDGYKLDRQTGDSSAAAKSPSSEDSKVRFTLATRRPLDREQSAEDHILIRCWDSGSPGRTATATAVVKVLDENDCQPEVKVFVFPTAAATTTGNSNTLPRASRPATAIDPWPTEKLRRWHEPDTTSGMWNSHPLWMAYLTDTRVYTVHVTENQPVGTVVARIQAIDRDEAENGRVTYFLPPQTSTLSLPIVNRPSDEEVGDGLGGGGPLHDQNYGYADGGSVKLHNSARAADYFKLNAHSGELSIGREIDREEMVINGDSSQMLEELYLFIKVSDHGVPTAKHTILLLQIRITDVNDNPPIFCNSEMHFEVHENIPAPVVVGEVLVRDRDIHSYGCHATVSDVAYSSPTGSVLPARDSVCKRLTLRIDPGHGRRGIPFVLYCNKKGQFFINTTQMLDRESEAVFKFNLIATDEDTRHTHFIAGEHKSPNQPAHTAVATVLITVVDTNDNQPEIIFPNPSTANSTVHRVSYRELAGHDILHVNAQDRDATESNRKLNFDLLPDVPGEDLFTIDRVTGILRTRRRLTRDDIGEHLVKVVVRDEGSPGLEAYVNIRLGVDESNPERPYVHQLAGSGSADPTSPDFIPPSGHDGQFSAARHYSGSSRAGYHPGYSGSLAGDRRSLLHTDVILIVIVVLILALLVVMVALCFYLRHKRNIFQFLPDICGLGVFRGLLHSRRSHAQAKHEQASNASYHGNNKQKKKLLANGKPYLGECDPATMVCAGSNQIRDENVSIINGDCSHGKLLNFAHHSHCQNGELMMPHHHMQVSDPSVHTSACSGFVGHLPDPGYPAHMFPSQMNLHEFYATGNAAAVGGYPATTTSAADCALGMLCASPVPTGEKAVLSPIPGMRNGRHVAASLLSATSPTEGGSVFSSPVYHRPGTAAAGVNIPDVADHAEMLRKKYVDYCRSMHSSVEPHQASHRSLRPYRGDSISSGYHTSPTHFSRHAYNSGLIAGHLPPQPEQPVFSPTQPQVPTEEAFYFNDSRTMMMMMAAVPHGGFAPAAVGHPQYPHQHHHHHHPQQQQQHSDALQPRSFGLDPRHEMSFRPIRDDPHMYQRLDPSEMYSTGKLQHADALRPTNVRGAQPKPRPTQHTTDLPSNGGPHQFPDVKATVWRSDPSLNDQQQQMLIDRSAVDEDQRVGGQSPFIYSHRRQHTGSPPPTAANTDYSQQQQQQSRHIRRSKSMQRQRPFDSATAACYYSLMHQPTAAKDRLHQQELEDLPLVDLGADSDQSKSAGVAVASPAGGSQSDNYAVSFPQVQASFV